MATRPPSQSDKATVCRARANTGRKGGIAVIDSTSRRRPTVAAAFQPLDRFGQWNHVLPAIVEAFELNRALRDFVVSQNQCIMGTGAVGGFHLRPHTARPVFRLRGNACRPKISQQLDSDRPRGIALNDDIGFRNRLCRHFDFERLQGDQSAFDPQPKTDPGRRRTTDLFYQLVVASPTPSASCVPRSGDCISNAVLV